MLLSHGQHVIQHHTLRLVESLNELVAQLHIQLPFALETPYDLTPGLLLGILESILESRLPISPEIRASRDFASKVQAMKVFLGVLEHDVLGGKDVGLSDVDPRRLAGGEEEELEFIGELLCWFGRQRGILAGPSRATDLPPTLPAHTRRPASPSTHSTVTSGALSNLSMMRTTLAETDTTIESLASEPLAPLAHPELPELPSLPQVSATSGSSSRGNTTRRPPRCIHELEEPSLVFDPDGEASIATSVCHCSYDDEDDGDDLPPTPKTPLPVRHHGWIHKANESAELHVFSQRRSPHSAPSSAGRRVKSYSGLSASPSNPLALSASSSSSGSRRIITPHNAPTEYTLALLNERARLLEELAKTKGAL